MKVTPVGRNFGSYKVGDSFEFPDKAAAVFIRSGKLRAAEDVAVKAKRAYRRRDMRAED
jgi:hypothetical protein